MALFFLPNYDFTFSSTFLGFFLCVCVMEVDAETFIISFILPCLY